MKCYALRNTLQEMPIEETVGETFKRVVLLTEEEFGREVSDLPHHKTMMHHLKRMEYCRAELFSNCIFGTLAIPTKKERVTGKLCLGFYLDNRTLYLIGLPERTAHLLNRIRENQFPDRTTVVSMFCHLLNSLVEDDAIYLQKIEDNLSELEESSLDRVQPHFYHQMMPYRRDLRALHAYYYQLINLAMTIRSNTNQMLSEEECLNYGYLSDRIQRLNEHTEMLDEYAVQIREIHQSQIEMRQTRSMNLLTVVSAIFLPLTLLVGWYGMNFAHMPELQWQFAYPVVAVISVLIVVVEIIWFHKKGLF